MKILQLKFGYSAGAQTLKGHFPARSHVDQMVEETTKVLSPCGRTTAVLLRRAMPWELHQLAFESWRIIKELPSNRAIAVGSLSLPRIKRDGALGTRKAVPGRVLKVLARNGVAQGTLGYLDDSPDQPCHTTPLTESHPEMLNHNKVLIKVVDLMYREFAPTFYARQRAAIEHAPCWRIWRTVFSTIYLAKNFRTAYHRDSGNLRGVLTALLVTGKFTGGELILPRWRIGFALRPGDVLLFDPQDLHGNLPFKGERLSAAFYCEKRIAECGKR